MSTTVRNSGLIIAILILTTLSSVAYAQQQTAPWLLNMPPTFPQYVGQQVTNAWNQAWQPAPTTVHVQRPPGTSTMGTVVGLTTAVPGASALVDWHHWRPPQTGNGTSGPGVTYQPPAQGGHVAGVSTSGPTTCTHNPANCPVHNHGRPGRR